LFVVAIAMLAFATFKPAQGFASTPSPQAVAPPMALDTVVNVLKSKSSCTWNVGGFGALVSASGVALAASLGNKKSTRKGHKSAMASAAGTVNVAAQPGVTAPMGEPGVSYWDPAGLSSNISEDRFRWYRQAEIKHGRVAMMALVGLVTQHNTRFNLTEPYDSVVNLKLSNIPAGLAALDYAPASYLFGCLVLIAGIHELRFSDDGRDPGDFGDPLGVAGKYGDKTMFRNFEINHGRLAMFGAIGTILAEVATGKDCIEQWEAAGSAWSRTFALTLPQGQVDALGMF